MKKIVITFVLAIIANFTFSQSMNVHKNDGSTTTIPLSVIDSITFTTSSSGTNYFISQSLWEGNEWCGNVNQGSWFPPVDSIAHYGISDYCWGQTRTINPIGLGHSMQYNIQVSLNSGGTNDDGAYFGFGDQWITYSGHSMGLAFINNGVYIFEVPSYTSGMQYVDTIGTYTAGQSFIFTVSLDNSGTLNISSTDFNGSFTPTNIISNPLAVLAVKDAAVNYGFIVRAITLY